MSKSISNIVTSNLNKASSPKADERVRFMLVIDSATRDELRNLAEALDVPQISFASEIFTAALMDALAVYAAETKKS